MGIYRHFGPGLCFLPYSFCVLLASVSQTMQTLKNEKMQISYVPNETKTIDIFKVNHYEKATKFEKNLPLLLTKQLFSLSSVKTSGRFFQIFVAFSEKLNFTYHYTLVHRYLLALRL